MLQHYSVTVAYTDSVLYEIHLFYYYFLVFFIVGFVVLFKCSETNAKKYHVGCFATRMHFSLGFVAVPSADCHGSFSVRLVICWFCDGLGSLPINTMSGVKDDKVVWFHGFAYEILRYRRFFKYMFWITLPCGISNYNQKRNRFLYSICVECKRNKGHERGFKNQLNIS